MKPMDLRGQWIGGRVPAPFYVTQPEPRRPHLVVWVDAERGVVPGMNMIEPDAPMDEAVDVLVQTLERPMPTAGRVRRPASIRVADPVLAEAIRARLGDEIRVDVGSTPLLDEVIQALAEFPAPAPPGPEPSYLEEGRVPPELVGRLFEAAARLYEIAPWKALRNESRLLALDVPELGVHEGCVSVIGALGQSYGVLLFDSIDGYEALARLDDRLQASRDPCGSGQPIFSVNFEGRDLPKALRREVKQHGWPVAGPKAYPRVMAHDPDGVSRPLHERDYRLAIALSEAVARFQTQHRAVFEKGAALPVSGTWALPEIECSVRVTAPHPDWDWASIDEPEPDYPGERRVKAARRAAEKLSDEFLAREEQRGRDRAWLDGAADALFHLFDFRFDYVDGRIENWRPWHVRTFLIEHFPRKVVADDRAIEALPGQLDAFFAWLGENGREPLVVVESIRQVIVRRRRSFSREARDPARFGPAKHVLTGMRSEGIDPTNRQEVDRYIARYNEGLREATHTRRPVDDPPRRPRWTRKEGEPVPDPKKPCPCGSGARYKKCCMPR